MKHHRLVFGASFVALANAMISVEARAQETLPAIDIGAAIPASGQTAGAGARNGTDIGAGSNGKICSDGLCNEPTSYAAPVQSLGTKVNTPVMETPLATKTVTHQMLEDQQVTTLDQALRNVSGVSVAGGGAIGNGNRFAGVTIRGFTTNAYYRDGIRVENFAANFSGVGDLEFANVDSVEVLKGPAAILYGAVEPGGIINLNLKQPLDKPAYSVEQQIGNYQSYRTTLDATGPLSANKDLLYRFTMSYENDGSFQQYGYTRNLFFSPVVKWNIDNNTWVKLETQYQENRFDQLYGAIPFYNSVVPLWLGRSWNWGPRSPFTQTQSFTQLTWNHDFGNGWSIHQAAFMQRAGDQAAGLDPIFMADASVNGADCNYNPAGNTVFTCLYAYPFENKQSEYATVVDLTGHVTTGDLKHTILIGGDYYRYNERGSVPNAAFSLGQTAILGAPSPTQPPSGFYQAFASETQADNIGVYVQDQIDLPFGFHALGGARYQYIGQRTQATDAGNKCGPYSNFGGPFIPCNYDTQTLKGSDVNQRVTPRAGLSWRPLEWFSIYGNYIESYNANYNGELVNGTNKPPPPSAGKQEEAGVKLELLDKKLQISADYYHLIKTNIPIGIPNDFAHVQLVGEGRSQGPELDIQGELLPGWTVNLAYANTDAITSKTVPGGSYNSFPPGSHIYTVPRNQASFGSNYEFKEGALKGLKFGARYDYTGYLPFYHSDQFGNYIYGSGTPSHGLVGLFAGYDLQYNGYKIHAQLNVDNLFDITYFNTGGFGWIPGYFPGITPPHINSGWNLQNNNVFGTPRTFRGAIKVAF